MTPIRFLKVALPAAAIPALFVLFLPADAWPTYVDVMEPLALFIGSLLALSVSFHYRKQLRAAFIFLSAFLFIYMLAIIMLLSFSPVLTPYLESYLGTAEIFRLVQGIQFITYALLFLFCLNLLKVINLRQLNRNGWIVFALISIFSIFVATYPKLELIKDLPNIGLAAISLITIRLFDAALIIIPVLWLYVQYLKSQQRQSLTFTVVIFGVVFSTLFDYLFEVITVAFPRLLTEESALYSTIPEMLFIYGYLIIVVGLYAHLKQDLWGYRIVDRAMVGDSKLVDVQ
ncbi:hypothetical protein ACFLTO_04095 [Chloroflexota bacterium]